MGTGDVGLLAGLFGVIMALIKLAEHAIKAALTKRNGGNGTERMIDIAREQLSTMRNVDREVAAIRSDLRAASIEQAHMQKSVDAMHRRIDAVKLSIAALGVDGD